VLYACKFQKASARGERMTRAELDELLAREAARHS
jgi:hypothetical protein